MAICGVLDGWGSFFSSGGAVASLGGAAATPDGDSDGGIDSWLRRWLPEKCWSIFHFSDVFELFERVFQVCLLFLMMQSHNLRNAVNGC